jgi:hypothetical protein
MKLDGFPLILWINLERSADRREHMEKMFKEYNLKNHRIEAVDGRKGIPSIYKCRGNIEFACSASHIEALKYFVEKTEEDEVVVMEDDISFIHLQYIDYDWVDFRKKVDPEYHILQLAYTSPNCATEIRRFYKKGQQGYPPYGTLSYMINRTHAKVILDAIWDESIKKYNFTKYEPAVADYLLYRFGNVDSFPLFSTTFTTSTIRSGVGDYEADCYGNHLKKWVAYAETRQQEKLKLATTKIEDKVDIKKEVKAEIKTEVKTEVKTETKTESKTETKTESKAEPKKEEKTEIKIEIPKEEPKVDIKNESLKK